MGGRLAPGFENVPDDFVLSVDGDRAAACESGKIDTVPPAGEGDEHSVVPHALATQPRADSGLVQEIHRGLFEDSGAYPIQNVGFTADLDRHGIDACPLQQMS